MSLDAVIRGGTVYDGTGGPGVVTDVAIVGDVIARVGSVDKRDAAEAGTVVDAAGLAVAPGFVNMLSHAGWSVLNDPRSLSELVQGVTTQLLGEGWSMGPLTEEGRARAAERSGGEAPWQSLREFLLHAERRGVSQNLASLVGATTLRIHGARHENRPMTASELDRVKGLLADEMADGAMGIGSALIYPPGSYASTEELVELATVAGRFGGTYFSHLRSEGDEVEAAIQELLRVSEEGELPAAVWHLKAIGEHNWPKMDAMLDTLEAAREAGRPVSANIYPYTAGGTELAACVPPVYADGGRDALREQLRDPSTRSKIAHAIATERNAGWENLYLASGGAAGVVIVELEPLDASDETAVAALAELENHTLAEYANAVGRDPVDALLHLIEHTAGVGCMYFIIDEANIAKAVARSWISVGSDADTKTATPGEPCHPRAFGTFARFLGHYCRDLGSSTLSEGIRRMSGLPASTLELDRRGELREGWFADVVVFDPEEFVDKATYEDPQQYAVGMRHVFVNGIHTLRDGEHTNSFAGRALTGPGRR